MKRGFTILELLVASLLLGMLMTILTMIFNQSSIAWRTGVAGIADMDDVRETVAAVRYQSDNAYPDLNGELQCVQSVFNKDGSIRTDRGFDIFEGTVAISSTVSADSPTVTESFKTGLSCGNAQNKNQNVNYVVNVMSAGPDGEMDTYDDIWSFPDDPNEW